MFRIIGGSWELEEAWDTYRRYLLHTWKTNEFHDPHSLVSRFLYTLRDLYVLELPWLRTCHLHYNTAPAVSPRGGATDNNVRAAPPRHLSRRLNPRNELGKLT